MNIKKQLLYLDYWLIIAVFILSIFGIICIGSATHINLGDSTSTYYSQIVWFIIGIFLMFFISMVDYNFFSQYWFIFYIINLLLLAVVLIIGTTTNGATRWIRFGPVGIQPSEFSKVIMIFCLAKFIDKKSKIINNIYVLITVFLMTVLPVYLIYKQPSLSASLVLIAIMCIMLFAGGLDYKLIGKFFIIIIPIVLFAIWDVLSADPIIMDKILNPYQINNRIKPFFYPESNPDLSYQTLKSIKAIGSGQLRGKGLFQGTLNQLSYLPEPHNDFIFSVIGEEFGFIGCTFVLLVMLFIVFRCILIALQARDFFSQLIVIGVAGMLSFQTFVSAGVTTGILPNTGMPLPFVSYGGSSMWTNMIAIGLVLNVNVKNKSKSLFEGG